MMNQGQVPSYTGRIQMRRSRKRNSLRATHTGGSDRLENPTKFKFRNRLQAKHSDWVAYSLVKTLALLMLMTLATNAMQQTVEEPGENGPNGTKFKLMTRKDKGSSQNYELRTVIRNEMSLNVKDKHKDQTKCFRFLNKKNFVWSITDISELVPDPKRKLDRVLLTLKRERKGGIASIGITCMGIGTTAKDRYLLLDHHGRNFLRYLMKYRKTETYMQPITNNQHPDFAKRSELRNLLCGNTKEIRKEMLRWLQNTGKEADLEAQENKQLVEDEFYIEVPRLNLSDNDGKEQEQFIRENTEMTMQYPADRSLTGLRSLIFEPKLKKIMGAAKWKSSSYEIRKVKVEYQEDKKRYSFLFRKNKDVKDVDFETKFKCHIKQVSFASKEHRTDQQRVKLKLGKVGTGYVRNRWMILDDEGLMFLRFLANQPKIYAKFTDNVKKLAKTLRENKIKGVENILTQVCRDVVGKAPKHFNTKTANNKKDETPNRSLFGTTSATRHTPYDDGVFFSKNLVDNEAHGEGVQLYDSVTKEALKKFVKPVLHWRLLQGKRPLVAITGTQLYKHLKNLGLPATAFSGNGRQCIGPIFYDSVNKLLADLNTGNITDDNETAYLQNDVHNGDIAMKQYKVAEAKAKHEKYVRMRSNSVEKEKAKAKTELDKCLEELKACREKQESNLYNLRKGVKLLLYSIFGGQQEKNSHVAVNDGAIIIADSAVTENHKYEGEKCRSVLEWAAMAFKGPLPYIYTLDITDNSYEQALYERLTYEVKAENALAAALRPNNRHSVSVHSNSESDQFSSRNPSMDTTHRNSLMDRNSAFDAPNTNSMQSQHSRNPVYTGGDDEKRMSDVPTRKRSQTLGRESFMIGKTVWSVHRKNDCFGVNKGGMDNLLTSDTVHEDIKKVSGPNSLIILTGRCHYLFKNMETKGERLPHSVVTAEDKLQKLAIEMTVQELINRIDACDDAKYKSFPTMYPSLESPEKRTAQAKKDTITLLRRLSKDLETKIVVVRGVLNYDGSETKPAWAARLATDKKAIVLDIGSGKMAPTFANGVQYEELYGEFEDETIPADSIMLTKGSYAGVNEHGVKKQKLITFKEYVKRLKATFTDKTIVAYYTGKFRDVGKMKALMRERRAEFEKCLRAVKIVPENITIDQEGYYGSKHMLEIATPFIEQTGIKHVLILESGSGSFQGARYTRDNAPETEHAPIPRMSLGNSNTGTFRAHASSTHSDDGMPGIKLQSASPTGNNPRPSLMEDQNESRQSLSVAGATSPSIKLTRKASTVSNDTKRRKSPPPPPSANKPTPPGTLERRNAIVANGNPHAPPPPAPQPRKSSAAPPVPLKSTPAKSHASTTTVAEPVPAEKKSNDEFSKKKMVSPKPMIVQYKIGDKVEWWGLNAGKQVKGVITAKNEDGSYKAKSADENQGKPAKVEAQDLDKISGRRRRRLAKLEDLLELCRENGYDQ